MDDIALKLLLLYIIYTRIKSVEIPPKKAKKSPKKAIAWVFTKQFSSLSQITPKAIPANTSQASQNLSKGRICDLRMDKPSKVR